MEKKVEKVIAKIKPMLAADGGSVELVSTDVKTGVVTVKLTGACGCCPHSAMTLKHVVEKMIKEEVSEVNEVRIG
jgi:Fe-S cluster biogenesis protein NfuA